ncbi:hypothetical protein [Tumidithrix helvetica]|uniref:hypothetical protein n=1 Tax=Tumidithrix helvetica TaxID=3457545 RepID=UPI003CC6AB02
MNITLLAFLLDRAFDGELELAREFERERNIASKQVVKCAAQFTSSLDQTFILESTFAQKCKQNPHHAATLGHDRRAKPKLPNKPPIFCTGLAPI